MEKIQADSLQTLESNSLKHAGESSQSQPQLHTYIYHHAIMQELQFK